MMTSEEIKSLFFYNDGNLYYKKAKQKTKQNKPVGYVNNRGYLVVRIYGCVYKVHRLIWSYFNGESPNEIDHINGIKTDNRIENLRNGDHSMNMQNRIEHREKKIIGVRKMGNKWQARIGINKKRYILGVFDTIEEAVEEYRKARKLLTT